MNSESCFPIIGDDFNSKKSVFLSLNCIRSKGNGRINGICMYEVKLYVI